VLPGHFTRTVHTHLGSRSGQSCCKEGGQHELCTAPAMVKKCVSPVGGGPGMAQHGERLEACCRRPTAMGEEPFGAELRGT
jgi:hypothetical protein